MSTYACLSCERFLTFNSDTMPDACECGARNVILIARDSDLALDLSIEQFEQNSAALYSEAFGGASDEAFEDHTIIELQRTAIAWGGVALLALAVLWMLPSGMEACQAIHSHDACFAALNR